MTRKSTRSKLVHKAGLEVFQMDNPSRSYSAEGSGQSTERELAVLDGFLYDELTDRIGFTNGGTHDLYLENIIFVGDLVATSETVLASIPGVGRAKIKSIREFLVEKGLSLNAPNAQWLAARSKRRPIEPRCDPTKRRFTTPAPST